MSVREITANIMIDKVKRAKRKMNKHFVCSTCKHENKKDTDEPCESGCWVRGVGATCWEENIS